MHLLLLGIKLNSCRFFVSKTDLFRREDESYLNQSNFLHFLLLFPISPGNSMTVKHGVFRGNPFIYPFLEFFVTGEVCVSVSVRVASTGRDDNPTVSSGEYARSGRTSHSSCRSVCFTFFATCGRALLCKRMIMRRLLTTDGFFLDHSIGIIAVGSDQ